MNTYRDHLAKRGLEPLVIERTEKKPGDLVLGSAAYPARRHGEIERLPFTGDMAQDLEPVAPSTLGKVIAALKRTTWFDLAAVAIVSILFVGAVWIGPNV